MSNLDTPNKEDEPYDDEVKPRLKCGHMGIDWDGLGNCITCARDKFKGNESVRFKEDEIRSVLAEYREDYARASRLLEMGNVSVGDAEKLEKLADDRVIAFIKSRDNPLKEDLKVVGEEELQSEIDDILGLYAHFGATDVMHYITKKGANDRIMQLIKSRDQRIALEAKRIDENTSDGYHTFKELYEYRMLYNALLFNEWANLENNPYDVHKSHTHSDGEPCFGGGWFVVVAETPEGQVANHYEDKDWDKFHIPVRTKANKWDGATPADVAARLSRLATLKQSQKEE